MGRLAQIQQQLSARQAARDAEKQAEAAQEALERQLLEQVARACSEGVKKVDLTPIVSAIKAIPEPPETDLSPLMARFGQIEGQLRRCMDMMAAEGMMTRNSMPKMAAPEKVDLSQVLNDLQWLKTVVSLDRQKDAAEETKNKSWVFTIERDRQGFIKTIRAE